MKYVSLVLLAVTLISSISLSSCRLANRMNQASDTQPDASSTQQQAPDTSAGSSAPSTSHGGSSPAPQQTPNTSSGSSSQSNTQPGSSSANKPPEARIISISPDEAKQGDTISFKGEGHDVDGTVVVYNWKSSIDGTLSNKPEFESKTLSDGIHTISFQVMDNDHARSDEVKSKLVINKLAVATVAKITNASIEWVISGSSGNFMFRWTVSGLKPNLEYYVYPDMYFNSGSSTWSANCDPKCHADDLEKQHNNLSNTFYYTASVGQSIFDMGGADKPQNFHGTLVLLSYDPASKTASVVDVSAPFDTSHW